MSENQNYFASVWEGLFLDPKGRHYQRMGRSLWLFLYLVRNADWKSGRLSRAYKTIAADMGIEVRVLKGWMSTLKAGGYIEICRRPYSMAIQITKWKPIKTQKGENERGDQIGISEPERSDNFGVKKGTFSYREGNVFVRSDQNGTSVNDSIIKPKVSRGDQNGTPIKSLSG